LSGSGVAVDRQPLCHLPVAYRLYLPKEWIKHRTRRNKAGVPRGIGFKTKPEIALEQIRWACEAGLPRGVALNGRRLWN
jgi:SRSO17 transposase